MKRITKMGKALKKLADMRHDTQLTKYAAQSIEQGQTNYPVSNLMQYCNDFKIKVKVVDLATEDCFYPTSISDLHDILSLLMDRYEVDSKKIYRKTGVHYTAPKNGTAPLSVKTLLAICDTVHCELVFISGDESSEFVIQNQNGN